MTRLVLGFVVMMCCACTPGGTGFSLAPANANKDKPTMPAPPKEANVIGVHVMAQPEPWIGFDRGGITKVGGVRFTLLLEAGGANKSVYGDGAIEITIHRMVRDPNGQQRRVAVRKWEYTSEQALDLLGRRPKAYGWWYGFRLPWGDADLGGQEIQVVAKFIRRDAQVIEARPLSLRVPK